MKVPHVVCASLDARGMVAHSNLTATDANKALYGMDVQRHDAIARQFVARIFYLLKIL